MDRLAFFDFMEEHEDVFLMAKILLHWFYENLLGLYSDLKNFIWPIVEKKLNRVLKNILIYVWLFFFFLIKFFIKIIKNIIKNIRPFLKLLIIIIATLCFFIKWFNMK